MRVAVAASGPSLDAPTDPRFGRCSHFVLVDTETMEFTAMENIAATQGSGAGIAAVQKVADGGVEAVIAANLGPNAYRALAAGGIRVYSFTGGTVRAAVEALLAGQLAEMADANVPSHTGMSPGGPGAATGMNGGMGAGRGAGGGMGGGGGRGVGGGMGGGGGRGGGGGMRGGRGRGG